MAVDTAEGSSILLLPMPLPVLMVSAAVMVMAGE